MEIVTINFIISRVFVLSKYDADGFLLIACTPNIFKDNLVVGCILMFLVPFYYSIFVCCPDFGSMFGLKT